MLTTLETWSLEEFLSVIRVLWTKPFSSIEILFQFIEVYVDGIVRVQHVRKLCTDFQNSWADIHNDCTVRLSMPSSDMKATRV